MSASYFETAEAVRSLGRDILPAVPGSQALYAAQHEQEPYVGVKVLRDERYGPHERHRLDVFTPAAGQGPRPIFLFVHGGGFVMGDKRQPGSPYLDNVALWAARNGMVGINITYRLAPEFKYPAGSEDVGAAVRWAREHAREIGGDPDRIFAMGTSAGAVHVAGFVAHPALEADRKGVKGVILLSGAYDLSDGGGHPAYYGEDVSRHASMSSLPGLVESPIPSMFVLTEFDPPMFERQALKALQAFSERHGQWPDFVRLMGHNHLTSTFHLNTDDKVLGEQMLAFIARQTAPAASSARAMAG
jgi:triacylglycerol lipase